MIRKILTALVAVGMMAYSASATVISKNGIAKDSVTGLEWQDMPYTDAEYKALDDQTNNGKVGNWEYVKVYCENLTLGGYSDWRLPNIYEHYTLIDASKKVEPYKIGGFQNYLKSVHWSSTTNEWINTEALAVGFYQNDAHDYATNKSWARPALCVRGRQLNFDDLAFLHKKNKLKITQIDIDKIKPWSAQELYLKAGKLERDGKNDKAKNIYEYIVDTFPKSDFAVKASDKLTGASRAENEASNRRSQSRQECENNKNACLAGCGTYISGADSHNNAVWSCNDKCKQISCY